MEEFSVRLTKVTGVPALTEMTVRVRCEAIDLSSSDPLFSVAARHGTRMTNDVAKIDPRKMFEVILENFTRLVRALPKNTVNGYAIRNSLAFIASSGATGSSYARILYIPTTATPGRSTHNSISASLKRRCIRLGHIATVARLT